eukprot:350521-Chlamydomonas_euryale.AAC.21
MLTACATRRAPGARQTGLAATSMGPARQARAAPTHRYRRRCGRRRSRLPHFPTRFHCCPATPAPRCPRPPPALPAPATRR